MAKSNIKLINVADLCCRGNASRLTMFANDADRNGMIQRLQGGWNPAYAVEVIALKDDEAEQELENRRSAAEKFLSVPDRKIQYLGENEKPETVTLTNADQFNAFAAIVGKGDKIAKPKFRMFTGNRRLTCIQQDLAALWVKGVLTDIPTFIPCIIRDASEFLSEDDEAAANIRANNTDVSRAPDKVAMLTEARRFFRNRSDLRCGDGRVRKGDTESGIMHAMGLKRGMAQEFHRLLLIDVKCGGEFVDRIQSGAIKLVGLDKETLKAKMDDPAFNPADFIAWASTDPAERKADGKSGRSASRDDILARVETFKGEKLIIFAAILKAVTENRLGALNVFNDEEVYPKVAEGIEAVLKKAGVDAADILSKLE